MFVCLFRVPLFRLFSVYLMENTNVNLISVAMLSIFLFMRRNLYFLYTYSSVKRICARVMKEVFSTV